MPQTTEINVLNILEAGMNKVQQGSVSWLQFSSWLTDAYPLSVSSHGLSLVSVERERERESSLVFLLIRRLILGD